MSSGKTLTLSTGQPIQQVGYGTWQAPKGEVGKATEAALKIGYRHLDLARVYGNQEEVGDAIRRSGVPRSEIFITSKLWNNAHAASHVRKDLDRTLEQLGKGVDYLDLFLIHWPVAFEPTQNIDELFPKKDGKIDLDLKTSLVDTWKAVVDLKKEGKVKAIGVSNFTKEHIEAIVEATGEKPAVNQIERHPRLSQPEFVEWLHDQGILVQAYSPLGNNTGGIPKIIDETAFTDYAKKLGVDPGSLALAWGRKLPASRTKSGKDIPIIILPKSVTPSRIESNFKDFDLTEEQFDVIDKEIVPKVGGQKRLNVPETYDPKWGINVWNDEREQDAKVQVKVA